VNLGDQAAKLRDMERDMDRQKAAAGGRTDVTRGDFGFALGVLHAGGRVTRESWNTHIRNTRWLVLVPGSTFTVTEGRPVALACPALVGREVGYEPHIDLYQSGTLSPWTPSTVDLLATDWWIIPPTPPGSEAGAL